MKIRPKTFELWGDSAAILQSNDFILSEVIPTGEFKIFKKAGISGKYHTGRVSRSKSGRLRLVLTGPIVKKDSPRDPDWRLRSHVFDKGLSGNIYSLKNQVEARIGNYLRIVVSGIMPQIMNDYRKVGKPKTDAYEEWLGKLISKYHEISKSKRMQLDEIIHLMFSSQEMGLDTRHLPLARAMDLFNAGAVELEIVRRRTHVDKKEFRGFLRKAKNLMTRGKNAPGWQRIADKMANLNSTSHSQAIREIPSILGIGVGVVERSIVDGRNTAVHASAWNRDDDTLMMDYEAALAFLQRLVLALIGHQGTTVDHTARGKHFQSLVAIGDPLSGGGPMKPELPKTRLLKPYKSRKHFYR